MSVLGTTVFQVPKLGETGFKIDQINEQKRKLAQQQLNKEVSSTGAEKAYMENAMGLTGTYKQIADASYDVFRQAAINYERTGSASAEARMKQAAGELTYSVTAGRTILDGASKEFVNNKANGFKDVALTPEEASELYTGFVNRTSEVIVKNGRVMIKDGDNFVPATQSTYLKSSVNMNNSLILPRTIKQGTYVNFTSYLNEVKGAISAGSSVENSQSRVNTLYEEKYKDKQFQSDVLTAYAVSQDDGLGMVEDPNKISAEQLDSISDLASNEEIVSQAKEWYRDRLMNSVPPLWNAGSSGAGDSASFNINVSEKAVVSITGAALRDKEGKLVLDKDENQQYAQTDVELTSYMPLPSNAQGKGLADSKSRSKYNIVGVGIQDGKLMFERNVAEGGLSIDNILIGKFTTDVKPATQQTFGKLPAKTQLLVKQRLAEQGYSLEEIQKLTKGISVSSQEDNTNPSEGMSDEEYNALTEKAKNS